MTRPRLWFDDGPSRLEQMRLVYWRALGSGEVKPPRPRFAGKPWKFWLKWDAQGRSLIGRQFRRSA